MRAIKEGVSVFCCALILAGLAILSGGIFMAELCSFYIEDTTIGKDLRLWLFDYYGTAARATMTMFEVTFSGMWPDHAHRTIWEVSYLFSVFWVFYIACIVFCFIRLVSAVFVKHLLKVADQDRERSEAARRRCLAGDLRTALQQVDATADASVDSENLIQALQGIHGPGADMLDLARLAEVLQDPNGRIDCEMFVRNALSLQGMDFNSFALNSLVNRRQGDGLQRIESLLKAARLAGQEAEL
jgi:hypothetical protein